MHVVHNRAYIVLQPLWLDCNVMAATAEVPQAATAEAPLRKKPKRAATAEALLKVKEEPENLNWDGADYGGTTDDEEAPSHKLLQPRHRCERNPNGLLQPKPSSR